MTISIQVKDLDGGWGPKFHHDIADCEEAMRFASALMNKPVTTIRRYLYNYPTLRSYTASTKCLFVRIAA